MPFSERKPIVLWLLSQEAFVLFYLRSGEARKVAVLLASPIPFNNPIECFTQWQNWTPSQFSPRLRHIEFQIPGFMGMLGGVFLPSGTTSPRLCQSISNPGYWFSITFDGTKIPPGSKPRWILREPFRDL
jgi:hypothetical protein